MIFILKENNLFSLNSINWLANVCCFIMSFWEFSSLIQVKITIIFIIPDGANDSPKVYIYIYFFSFSFKIFSKKSAYPNNI